MIFIEIAKSEPGVFREVFLLLLGAFFAFIFSLIQSSLARKQRWQLASESMLKDLDEIQQKIERLALNPTKQNTILLFYIYEHCSHMLRIKSKDFKTKKKRINDVINYIKDSYTQIILDPENEKLINQIGVESPRYDLFIKSVSMAILDAFIMVIGK
ncbi:hypothetical protein SDC9_89970 [bioreactor metagenome]|uniref:Uncharacterized protein n=1 Tax=bioreactor metagenome TaxID=1076179 RepID=A0A644ZRA8_9ZZZZ